MKKMRICSKLFLFVFFIISVDSAAAESCSNTGLIQYKPNGCETSSRTCCASGIWSAWGSTCKGKDNCTSSQCWNGSKCEDKGSTSRSCVGNVSNSSGGTQTRTATCGSGGWQYGSWSGTCTCKSGYQWSSGSCVLIAPQEYVWDNGKGNYISFCDDEPNCVSTSIAGTKCTSLGAEKTVCITQGYSNGICIVKDFTCVEK